MIVVFMAVLWLAAKQYRRPGSYAIFPSFVGMRFGRSSVAAMLSIVCGSLLLCQPGAYATASVGGRTSVLRSSQATDGSSAAEVFLQHGRTCRIKRRGDRVHADGFARATNASLNQSGLSVIEFLSFRPSVSWDGGARMLRSDVRCGYDVLRPFRVSHSGVATETAGPPNTVPAPGGAARAAKWGGNWQEASLSETVADIAGPNPVASSTAQKTIYTNPTTGTQVIYDRAGNYFRIADSNGQYLMLNGQPVPANVPILKPGGGSAMSGVPKDVRNGLTHFGAKP